MMRHPFDEVVAATAAACPAAPAECAQVRAWRMGRRGFFASMAAAAAGLITFLAGRESGAIGRGRVQRLPAAQRGSARSLAVDYTTLALGEEGGTFPAPPTTPPTGSEMRTTLAFGEEGGGAFPGTTLILGEEG